MKCDVAADLPQKSEQVLFCKLTVYQRREYERFLKSNEVVSILEGQRHALYGIDILRKICNHPDILHKNEMESVRRGRFIEMLLSKFSFFSFFSLLIELD